MPESPVTISVITVCFNAAHLLKKTIESVIEQTYESVEYIIIDGASNDNTVEIVKRYGDNVHQFISEPDTGLYNAMNKGIKIATGDLVIFLNAGDYYVSSRVLEYTVTKLSYSKADVFFGRFIWETPLTKDIVLSDHSSTKFDWDLKGSNFPHPATFYKTEILLKLGFFDENYKIMADYEWNVRALVKYRIPFQYINIVTVKFTADGISNNLSYENIIESETNRISNEYYNPKWLFRLVESHIGKETYLISLTKKTLAKVFKKRLNKIY